MAETVEEQMEYGTLCVHGRNLGTPGGADLMCGWCEDGYTHWVDDPSYMLYVGFRQVPPKEAAFAMPISWRQSELTKGEVDWGYVADCLGVGMAGMSPEMAGPFQWRVYQVEGGYWDVPPPSPEELNDRLTDAIWYFLGTGDLPEDHNLPDDLRQRLLDATDTKAYTRLLEAVDESVQNFLQWMGLTQ